MRPDAGCSRIARAAPRPARSPGFSLLELLLVMALMAMGLALITGVLAGALPGQQLRTEVGSLAAELRATRARALASGVDQWFVLDTGSGAWHSGPAAGPPRRRGELASGLRIAATVALEEQTGAGEAALRFFADGSSSGGRIVLGRGGAAWRVDVAWLTGRVAVARDSGDDAGAPP